jgi:diaminopimelate decarboxylase
VLEPGRWIVGPAGLLLTRVVDFKAQPPGDASSSSSTAG